MHFSNIPFDFSRSFFPTFCFCLNAPGLLITASLTRDSLSLHNLTEKKKKKSKVKKEYNPFTPTGLFLLGTLLESVI